MILKQYYLGCLAHASYLIGDEETRIAVVVDPQRDIDQYLDDAQTYDFHIDHVFLTHFHADYVAGHLEMHHRTGATVHLGIRAKAEYAFTAMKDGDDLVFGTVRLQILETPGHTPESICIAVYDLSRSDEHPHAVLTGDTLFIGDVGRPDLMASLGWTQDELAAMLYESIQQKILPLPDDAIVYPGHGAGSMCGKNLSKDTVSTIGAQRQYNYALQPMSKEAFISIVTADQPDAPAYFSHDAVLNASNHPTLEQSLKEELKPLTPDEVRRLKEEGARLLDTRDPTDFEGAHMIGSLNVGLGGQFATWAGTILSHETPIVIIAEPGSEEESTMRLGRIGFDNVVGYLDGGMQALDTHPDLVGRTERITAATLAEQLELPDAPLILDIRTEGEWQREHIDGSLNIPLNHLAARIDEAPTDRRLVVHCQSGYRSSIAVSLLKQRKDENVTNLVGGILAWKAAQLETVE